MTYWSMQLRTAPLTDGVYHVYTTVLPEAPFQGPTVVVDCTTPQCRPTRLGGTNDGVNGRVHSLVAWDSDGPGPQAASLLAAGSFSSAGGSAASNIAAWNGSRWQAFGGGISGTNPVVLALSVHNGELIAAGRFSAAGEAAAQNIARWDGSQWHPLGAGVSSSQPPAAAIHAIVSFQGDLVVGGNFTDADGLPARNVARWDGTRWHALGDGLPSTVSLAVHEGQLFAASGSVWRWDGSQWQDDNPAFPGFFQAVTALRVYDGHLVAGTSWYSFGGHHGGGVAYRTGAEWRYFEQGWWGAPVGSLTVVGGALMATTAAPSGWYPSGYADVLRWDGAAWSPIATADGPIRTLALHREALVAGGEFTNLGGVAASSVVRWTCSTPACPADWDASGAITSADISSFLASWLLSVAEATLFADFNADSVVNSMDVSAFLAAWVAAFYEGC